MTIGGFGGVVWCLVGDFNSVIDATERRGVTHGVAHTSNSTREMLEFR
jgi:hypothetical protein